MLLKRISLLIALLLVFIGGYAQKATIKGVICDDNGKPLAQVVVADEATGLGGYTDKKGNYSIEVPADKCLRLVYFACGFKAVYTELQVAPGAAQTIDMQLNQLSTKEIPLITATDKRRREEIVAETVSQPAYTRQATVGVEELIKDMIKVAK